MLRRASLGALFATMALVAGVLIKDWQCGTKPRAFRLPAVW